MRETLWTALDRIESKNMDPILLLAMSRLVRDLADIERILRDARQGKYHDHCKEPDDD
jgi:hypothetical protein